MEHVLRLLPSSIAQAIHRSSNPGAFRSFACTCAHSALSASSIEEPLLLHALQLAGNPASMNPDEIAHVQNEVAAMVEHFDDLAFHAQETFERDNGGREAYLYAFRKARAATSVLRTLDYSAQPAATESCYEAFHALDESHAEKELWRIAKRYLS